MTAHRHPRRALSDLLAALASPVRLAIIDVLEDEGELSVRSVRTRLGLSTANVSQHLLVLRQQGVVRAQKIGTQVFCRINDPTIPQTVDLLNDTLKADVAEAGVPKRPADLLPQEVRP